MTHVHLPAEHSEDDLALAGALAEALESAELYVAWTLTSGNARPVVPAAVRHARPSAPPPRRLAALLQSLRVRRRRGG